MTNVATIQCMYRSERSICKYNSRVKETGCTAASRGSASNRADTGEETCAGGSRGVRQIIWSGERQKRMKRASGD